LLLHDGQVVLLHVCMHDAEHHAHNALPPCAQAAPPPPAEGLQLNARSSKRQATAKRPAAVKLDGVHDGVSTSISSSSAQQQQPPVAPSPPTPAPGFQQTVVTGDSQAVKVSLNDCLACSGCVTSAETVLLEAQSLKEFVGRCADADTRVVVSMSPQSRASLAGEGGWVWGSGVGSSGSRSSPQD
jgi:hypothetical protein